MNENYAWRGGSELLLRHGQGSQCTVLILPALFEEANRMRRFTVSVMRHLAERGIGSILPDLPGTGESIVDLEKVTFADWQDAVAALAETLTPCLTVAIRGGALLDRMADYGWRLASETGERLLRDMLRATALTGTMTAATLDMQARQIPTVLAGNTLSPALYGALAEAVLPLGKRQVTTVAGTRLWRSAEPGDDPIFAQAIADDILLWTNTCVAF